MSDALAFGDELGPAKVMQVYKPSLGLKAVLPRAAALNLATRRVRQAIALRRFPIF